MNKQEVEIDKPIVSNRIYFSMLQKVGTLGRYQIILMVFVFIVGIQASSCFLVNPYLFYQQQFNCPPDIKDCKQFVCKLSPQLRTPYTPVPDGRLSLANQFGDFRCEGASYVTLLNSSIILGSVIGIFSAIFFTEWLGRRGTMIFSLVLGITGLFITFINSQTAAVVGVFLYGAGLDISYSSAFTFVTEFFAQQHRGKFYNLISLSFAVGTLVNPISFYFIYNWKVVAIFVFILPIIIAVFGFIFFVQNTPIQLISYHTPEDTFAAFMRIAKWNRIQNHGLTLQAVREVKQQYDENQRKKHARVFSIIDLIRYDSLRKHLIPLGTLKFLMMFIYYTPGLLLDQFAMSIYLNGIVNGISQICGIPLQELLLRYQRKMSNYLLFSASAAFALGMWIAKQMGGGSGSAIESVLLFLYRISCTIVSFIVVVMLNETYPAQIRNLAIFFNISFGRAATLLVPFVSSFCEATRIPFLILLSIASLLGTFTTCFTVQTFGIPPPEMIQQVKIEQHHYKYYKISQKKQ